MMMRPHAKRLDSEDLTAEQAALLSLFDQLAMMQRRMLVLEQQLQHEVLAREAAQRRFAREVAALKHGGAA